MFTSGIVATCDGRRIALFFSGHQHAGENLKDLLAGGGGTRRRHSDVRRPREKSAGRTANDSSATAWPTAGGVSSTR